MTIIPRKKALVRIITDYDETFIIVANGIDGRQKRGVTHLADRKKSRVNFSDLMDFRVSS